MPSLITIMSKRSLSALCWSTSYTLTICSILRTFSTARPTRAAPRRVPVKRRLKKEMRSF